MRRLAELDADVVCLQEVGVAEWDVLSQRLGDIGYDVLLQQMSNDHPVANAVLLRKGHVELVRSESRSRALITVLRACPSQRHCRSACSSRSRDGGTCTRKTGPPHGRQTGRFAATLNC